MDLREYFRILRKNWWIVAVCAVLGVGGALFINLRSTPEYQSSVTFYVSTPSSTTTGGSALQANQYALDNMGSYTKLLTSDALARRVLDKTGLDMTVASVTRRISASSELNTVLLEAQVTDEDPARSLALATAVSTEFGPLVDQLSNRTVDGVSGSTVQMNVVSGPTLDSAPISPRKNLNLAIGLAMGLLLGAALALARGLLDTTIRSAEDLGRLLRIPVLGTVGFESAARKYPVLVASQQRSIRAESFRQLRTNLQFMNVDTPVKTLVVTSAVAGEGKSTTSTNLALVYAETGRKVLLIEADMRRGRIAEYLGLEDAVGLSNVLAGSVDVRDVLQTWGNDQLSVLLRGEAPPNPSEMLGSHHMIELMDQMRELFDVIIVDAPPLLPVTDAAVASTWADGVLVVVRWGKATRSQVNASMEALEGVDARVLGTVLTMRPHHKSDRVKGYQAYGIYDEEEPIRVRRFGRKSKAPRDSASSADPARSASRDAAATSSDTKDASPRWVPTLTADDVPPSEGISVRPRTMGEALGMDEATPPPAEVSTGSDDPAAEPDAASPQTVDEPGGSDGGSPKPVEPGGSDATLAEHDEHPDLDEDPDSDADLDADPASRDRSLTSEEQPSRH